MAADSNPMPTYIAAFQITASIPAFYSSSGEDPAPLQELKWSGRATAVVPFANVNPFNITLFRNNSAEAGQSLPGEVKDNMTQPHHMPIGSGPPAV